MGRPLPGLPVVLVDPLDRRLVEGSARARSASTCRARPLPLMTGYQGDAERNAEAMAGGYYHTGDVASRDEDGYITYVGRTDDVFKASDYKISPFELESVLIEHPAVAEAAVVPAPDPVRLAVPKAYVALAPGYEPTEETAFEILKYAREHLAPYLRVRRLEFYELPKTISGKIRRVELRGRENDLAAGSAQFGDGSGSGATRTSRGCAAADTPPRQRPPADDGVPQVVDRGVPARERRRARSCARSWPGSTWCRRRVVHAGLRQRPPTGPAPGCGCPDPTSCAEGLPARRRDVVPLAAELVVGHDDQRVARPAGPLGDRLEQVDEVVAAVRLAGVARVLVLRAVRLDEETVGRRAVAGRRDELALVLEVRAAGLCRGRSSRSS